MKGVRAKKHLGQHFLKDTNIANKIVDSMTGHKHYKHLLEIGPGTGVLSDFLIEKAKYELLFMDVDQESIDFLQNKYPDHKEKIIQEDFLRIDLGRYYNEPFGIIGNFPYNISSQIFFKVLEYRNQIPEVVGMIQKEVAERIASKEGNKTYGILSVLLQAYYKVEYLFSVPPNVFNPPPKVTSAVLRLRRNETKTLACDEKLFFRVVKQGFNNRRKTLRNALKTFDLSTEIKSLDLLDKRAEQLTVNDFVELTNHIANGKS
ncbi:16S rRNA (adenine(1518)-N(6)/adenine(1519)-N(6))-dimethyltransferase RsmA [Marivirga harenae]|uniref:16S rRNA (adenine(1518)-N(6)/adenine(1519)-N(6))- dimethyltransferase RsmA n=1 Tax=Marivirga harenae TaxID=2010992 RepID=UPI0026DFA919|nr:16S rRNA (adenine(1518)-N(6)/adenine(1519)-N(6))-dimethyltransferase RsmA [Marivirga harenae]WKV10665.1 16S rRNA (adenine(1518)-N(6)/adenine(1519)-N(6))-dimethyltransferase RsmA [Marivirga harenae]|tara:strand:- start:50170 stop:50952 length:783 start_codon:yes stop_codon:yes gene_type:complete